MKRSIQSLVAKTGYSPSGALEGGFGSIRGGTGASGARTNSPPDCKTNAATCTGSTNTGTICTNVNFCAGSTNFHCVNSGNCSDGGGGTHVSNGVCTNTTQCQGSVNSISCGT